MPTTIQFDPYQYPVLGRFHDSDAFISAVQGPYGSGKSTGAIVKLWYNACEQPQAPDGIRYRRTVVIRNTYSQLQSTTIKTFSEWFPEEKFPVVGQAPIECEIDTIIPDGTRLKWTIWFMALDKPADLVKIKSLDVSDCWVNEAIEVPIEMIINLLGRVGRFPHPKKGGCPNPQMVIDTNPGDEDEELYKLLEQDDADLIAKIEEMMKKYSRERPLIEFFEQPGGLIRVEKEGKADEFIPEPGAENIDNLNGGYGYYFQQLVGRTRTSIDKFILGKKGALEDGKAIYQHEYKDEAHFSRDPIEPISGKIVLVGMDFGLQPAAAVTQVDDTGRLVVLSELVSTDMGVQEFTEDVLIPYLEEELPGYQILIVCDPSIKRAETDARTPVGILKLAGLKVVPAYTNSPLTRINDVRYFLLKRDGFILNPSCKYLRKGFQNGYKYRRLQVSGNRYSSSPDKNHFSHIHDGLQYVCGFVAQQMRKKKAPLEIKKANYRYV